MSGDGLILSKATPGPHAIPRQPHCPPCPVPMTTGAGQPGQPALGASLAWECVGGLGAGTGISAALEVGGADRGHLAGCEA
ncbi:hypothetical protein E2C01_094249 [Portunus trituberculatus]|uniref:Uncharacterized protein n=1 Tax=Portunus trituberculatus TaxID=210409 RepID=A0A5B7K2L6_PORTR|nr:hypothetical protein [Portunus trituberculatus]